MYTQCNTRHNVCSYINVLWLNPLFDQSPNPCTLIYQRFLYQPALLLMDLLIGQISHPNSIYICTYIHCTYHTLTNAHMVMYMHYQVRTTLLTFSLFSMATKLVNCDTMEYSLLMFMMYDLRSRLMI